MLNTVLIILKILGIVLLCIVCLVFTLILLVLFVPVRYKGNASKKDGSWDSLSACGGVSWLLHILSASYEYGGDGKGLVIKIFGIRLKSSEEREENRRKRREKKRGNEIKTEAGGKSGKTQVYVEEHEEGLDIEYPEDGSQNTGAVDNDTASDTEYKEEYKEDIPVGSGNEMPDDEDAGSGAEKLKEKLGHLAEQIRDSAGRLPERYESLRKGLGRACGKVSDVINDIEYYHNALFNDRRNGEVIKLLILKLKRLIRAVRPRKVRGHLDYGSTDPSTTGKVLACAAVIYPWYGNNIAIDPDFENERLAFDMDLKGRIYLCVVAKVMLQLYFNRKVKRFIRIMKKENSTNG